MMNRLYYVPMRQNVATIKTVRKSRLGTCFRLPSLDFPEKYAPTKTPENADLARNAALVLTFQIRNNQEGVFSQPSSVHPAVEQQIPHLSGGGGSVSIYSKE